MAWLIAVAILVVSLLVAAGFRKSALGLALAALTSGVAIYVLNERQDQQETSRIAVSEVSLENVDLRPTFRSSYDLLGTVRNNSKEYRLDGFDVTVRLRDCRNKDPSTCAVIAQTSAYAAVAVPPEEARNFIVSLHFGGDRPTVKGTLAWDHQITAVTAKRQ